MKRLSVLLVAAFGLPACATVTTGTSQSLSVVSDPPGAACQLERGGQVVGVASPTPATVQVGKSMRAISVECAQPGYEKAAARIPAGFQPLFLGNVLLGGVVGMVVDMASGAAATYPASTTVAMRATGADPAPGGGTAPELPPIASSGRRLHGALPAGGPIRLAAATAPAARRKLLVRVDHVDAAGVGSPEARAGRGLIVLEVVPGGVGAAAGLQPGDVIVALDGMPVASVEDMRRKLGAVGANGTVAATVRRDGRDRSMPLHF